ncbi:hypothetical protein EDD22DRAFT_847538 [Suillus occidentalis]|nr:hypothetical protein EDD22DRAFT_847538 [Suillus occidentalis]
MAPMHHYAHNHCAWIKDVVVHAQAHHMSEFFTSGSCDIHDVLVFWDPDLSPITDPFAICSHTNIQAILHVWKDAHKAIKKRGTVVMQPNEQKEDENMVQTSRTMGLLRKINNVNGSRNSNHENVSPKPVQTVVKSICWERTGTNWQTVLDIVKYGEEKWMLRKECRTLNAPTKRTVVQRLNLKLEQPVILCTACDALHSSKHQYPLQHNQTIVFSVAACHFPPPQNVIFMPVEVSASNSHLPHYDWAAKAFWSQAEDLLAPACIEIQAIWPFWSVCYQLSSPIMIGQQRPSDLELGISSLLPALEFRPSGPVGVSAVNSHLLVQGPYHPMWVSAISLVVPIFSVHIVLDGTIHQLQPLQTSQVATHWH